MIAARETAPQSDRYRFVIGALLILLQIALGLNWMAVTPLFSIVMDDLHIDRATVSLLFSVVPITQAVFTIPAGIIAARIGVGRMFAFGAVAMSAGVLALAAPGFLGVIGVRVLFGLGTALFAPLAGPVMMQWFRGRELPVMNGLNLVAGSLGVSTGLFLTVPVQAVVGWRGTLVLFGAFAGIGALAWLILGSGRTGRVVPVPATGKQASLLDVLRRPATYWLALALAGPICYYDVLVAWLPTYYNQVFGMDLGQAANITGLLGLTGIPASLGGALLSARLGLRRPFLLVPGALVGVAGLGTFLVNDVRLIIPAVVLFGLLAWVYTPVLFTMPMEMPGLSPALVAVVTGMVLTISGVGAFFAPLIAGFLTDRTGSYLPGFWVFAVGSLVLLLAAVKLPETGPRAKKPAALAVEPQPSVAG